jgi:hypothetical protein
MYIFNGTYSWDGKRHGDRDPIAWFAGSYNLLIINLQAHRPGVRFLKPYLCVFSETGHGHSISANPEKFAKHVCTDFSLELERVLWVEKLPSKDRYEVVVFTRSNRLGDKHFYRIDRRPPTAAESNLISNEIKAHIKSLQ